MDLGLEPAVLAEKLQGPRPLVRVGHGLYAPPRPGSTVAWAAWVYVPPALRRRGHGAQALAALEARAQADGATRLRLGGPPGNYCVPGVPVDDPALPEALSRRGYRPGPESVDLIVNPTDHRGFVHAALRRGEAHDLAWIAAEFSTSWAEECARALRTGGVWVTEGADGSPEGFVAWGGNLASRGRFGPVGVVARARGRGHGAVLTRAALGALADEGFATVTVPWVAAETVGFYAAFGPVLSMRRHVVWEKGLGG